jgi:predicted nucleic acid-binding protein
LPKKNTRTKPKLLIDTTFLLPALGFEVEESAMKAIELFRKYNIYYIEFGILEAMWKILKIIKSEQLIIVYQGLEAIRETYKKLEVPIEAYIDSFSFYNKGHKDIIDAIYYFTSIYSKIPLLTIDENLIEFLLKNGYNTDLLYRPSDLNKLL